MDESQALRRWLRGQRLPGLGRVWYRARAVPWWRMLGGVCALINAYWSLYWLSQGHWVACVMQSCGALLGGYAAWQPPLGWLLFVMVAVSLVWCGSMGMLVVNGVS